MMTRQNGGVDQTSGDMATGETPIEIIEMLPVSSSFAQTRVSVSRVSTNPHHTELFVTGARAHASRNAETDVEGGGVTSVSLRSSFVEKEEEKKRGKRKFLLQLAGRQHNDMFNIDSDYPVLAKFGDQVTPMGGGDHSSPEHKALMKGASDAGITFGPTPMAGQMSGGVEGVGDKLNPYVAQLESQDGTEETKGNNGVVPTSVTIHLDSALLEEIMTHKVVTTLPQMAIIRRRTNLRPQQKKAFAVRVSPTELLVCVPPRNTHRDTTEREEVPVFDPNGARLA
eukprot:GDKI01012625.1.p1 GENE.GDKI01012625.1~~GDKI01012625.1.p1  ORF type:complete len:329 (+),score=127.48 GDKI01012625.1:141-989(+)